MIALVGLHWTKKHTLNLTIAYVVRLYTNFENAAMENINCIIRGATFSMKPCHIR